MSLDTSGRAYWREEVSLIALLPLSIGCGGIALTLAVALEQLRRHRAGAVAVVDADDPATRADWPRYATALLSAPAFGLLFWLFGFIIASFAAMMLIPLLMGYANRRRLVVTAAITVPLLPPLRPSLLT